MLHRWLRLVRSASSAVIAPLRPRHVVTRLTRCIIRRMPNGMSQTSSAVPRGTLPTLVGLWRNPIGFFSALAREQGDFAHVRIGRQDLFLLLSLAK